MTRARSLLVLLLSTALGASASAQGTAYRAPRTESGHPDLQGVWNFNSGVPLQRPVALAGRKVLTKEEFEARRGAMMNVLNMIAKFAPVEAIGLDWMDNRLHVDDLRTSLISYPESGRLPEVLPGVKRMPQIEDLFTAIADSKGAPPLAALAPAFAAFTGGKKNSYTDFMPSERCLFDAFVPMVPQLDDNHVQIVQGPGHVVLIADFWRRVVALDGRPHPAGAVRSWTGISKGRWEGDTLIVETRNFNDSQPSFAGVGTGRDKVVTERFTRTAPNRLNYSATVVDPRNFKDRVELSFPMAQINAGIHEGGCHEGNYSMRNSLAAARLEDEQAAKAK